MCDNELRYCDWKVTSSNLIVNRVILSKSTNAGCSRHQLVLLSCCTLLCIKAANCTCSSPSGLGLPIPALRLFSAVWISSCSQKTFRQFFFWLQFLHPVRRIKIYIVGCLSCFFCSVHLMYWDQSLAQWAKPLSLGMESHRFEAGFGRTGYQHVSHEEQDGVNKKKRIFPQGSMTCRPHYYHCF